MSMPMSNLNKDGYVPPGYNPNGQQPAGNNPAQYGFVPGQQQGYAPVPQQMPYGEAPFGGGAQYNNAAPPGYGGQPQYEGGPQQPYYGGGPQQPYYGGGAPQQQYNVGSFQQNYGAPPGPILTQPGAPMQPGQPMGNPGEWMSIPAGIPNCPRGLEYLTSVDQLIVQQKVELLEAFTGFETNNKFSIKNALGQKVFFAAEDTDCCTRNMCGSARPFDMKIFDNFRNEVMHIQRPLACSCCLFPCCLQKMEISAPPGNVIGTIEQEWTFCAPAFSIKNHLGDTMLRIEGPVCTISLCGDVNFNVVSLTGESVGKISKQWTGAVRELFTDADTFGVTFPMDLDVRMKAVLLGATFLIDAMFFEKGGGSA